MIAHCRSTTEAHRVSFSLRNNIIELPDADDGELNSKFTEIQKEKNHCQKSESMSSSYTQVEQQQNVAPPALDAASGEPQDVGAVVLKAKKAAASLWMILHAQVSVL